MSLTGLLFLFWFLPVVMIVYYLSNDRVREYILVAAGLLFYAVISLKYAVLIIVLTIIVIAAGRVMSLSTDHRVKRMLMTGGIVICLSVLALYKYIPVIMPIAGDTNIGKSLFEFDTYDNIILPLGISFFTFKAISYLADIYSGKITLSPEVIHDALYLTFFAQIQSGPLSRYNDMKCPDRDKCVYLECIKKGVFRFVTGFCKKVVLADMLANIVGEIFGKSMSDISTSYAWLGAVCFSLQLYYDFSGYSDMAIGITEMFGYKCPENFNYPYMTESISQFWRRWHISLGQWFRDYVYIPMGGSRCDKPRVYLNLLVVWLLTGLWHGAQGHFLMWGIIYFILIAAEKLTDIPKRLHKGVTKTAYRIVVLLLINFQWVMFRADSLSNAIGLIRRMIIYTPGMISDRRTAFLLYDNRFILTAAIILCFPVIKTVERYTQKHRVINLVFQTAYAFALIGVFVWAVSFVVCGQNNPFAYANF